MSHKSPGKMGGATVAAVPSEASLVICKVEDKVSAGHAGGVLVGLKTWRQAGKFDVGLAENGRQRLSR